MGPGSAEANEAFRASSTTTLPWAPAQILVRLERSHQKLGRGCPIHCVSSGLSVICFTERHSYPCQSHPILFPFRSLVTPICRSMIRSMILAREKLLGVDQVSARRVVLGQLLGGCAQELDLSRKNAAKKRSLKVSSWSFLTQTTGKLALSLSPRQCIKKLET